jgi:hypothetical protein
MESFVTVCAFLSFSSLFSFGSGGIGEGFCVPFLLCMCMRFPLIFIFRFMIFWLPSCTVSACALGPLIAPMLMSLVCSCVRDSIKSSREGIFQVAPEVNLTVWNVDTNTENSGPSLERMVRTICFSSVDLSTPQALSCDSKSLNFVKKYWILSKLFGSNVRSSTSIMCPLISSYFPKIPSNIFQASLGVLQEDM